jgi:polar amino acid transport system permease protein
VILSGLGKTIYISVVSMGMALGLGFVFAYFRLLPNRFLNRLAFSYVELFRNIPLLIQLYFFYRGLPAVGIQLPPEMCGIIGLSLYSGAYMTEIIRSALLALPKEQLETGLCLGMSPFETYRLILIPQSVPVMIPAMTNQCINLMKNSSLLFYITVEELFHVVYQGAVDGFRPVEYFLIGAVLYMGLSWCIAGVFYLLESLFEKVLVPRWFQWQFSSPSLIRDAGDISQ